MTWAFKVIEDALKDGVGCLRYAVMTEFYFLL